jgi:hypothetical protein
VRHSENDGLPVGQKRALVALVSEPTVKAAAVAAGVGRATLYRYMASGAFRAALARRQSEVLAVSSLRLAGMLEAALDVVGRAVNGERVTTTELRAAALVLRHVTGLLEYASLEERVLALEERSERGEANGRRT